MQAQTRLLLVTAHRWLGLGLLLWFVMLGLTGSVLVYQDEVDAWLNPQLLIDPSAPSRPFSAAMQPAPAPEKSPLWYRPLRSSQSTLDSALQTFPEAGVERIRVPQRAGEVYRLVLRERALVRIGSPRFEATFSSTNGAMLGHRKLDGYGLSAPVLMRTVYDLHHRVLLGNPGKTAVGIVGALLLVMVTIGLLIALPRKGGARAWRTMVGIKRGAHRVRLIFDLHRSIGVFAFGLLIVSTASGFALAFPDYARDALNIFSPVRSLPIVPFVQREDLPNSALDPVLFAAEKAHPGARITEIHLPQRRSGPLLVYLREPSDWQRRGDTLLMMDPATGTIKLEHGARSRSTGEQVFQSVFPIHSGAAWGDMGRGIMFVSGLLPLCLSVTGVLIWWHKRRAASVAQGRRGGAFNS